MYYAYVLQDSISGKLYIGRSDDLKRRLKEHRDGKVHTTSRMNNPQLTFYEAFRGKSDAIRRERYFKTSKGRKTLRLMLRDSLRRHE